MLEVEVKNAVVWPFDEKNLKSIFFSNTDRNTSIFAASEAEKNKVMINFSSKLVPEKKSSKKQNNC